MSAAAYPWNELDCTSMLCSKRSVWVDAGPSRITNVSEDQLIKAVHLALCATGHAPLRDLDIEISRGVIVLRGRVPTYYDKQLAQVAAQRVDGIREKDNGLDVICRQRH